jgi:hypothetical protein
VELVGLEWEEEKTLGADAAGRALLLLDAVNLDPALALVRRGAENARGIDGIKKRCMTSDL